MLTLTLRDPRGELIATRALDGSRVVLGRQRTAEWSIQDYRLSKTHCVFELRDGGYWVTDVSTNGVFLNGSTAAIGRGKSAMLRPGDVLTLADYTIGVDGSVDDDRTQVMPAGDDRARVVAPSTPRGTAAAIPDAVTNALRASTLPVLDLFFDPILAAPPGRPITLERAGTAEADAPPATQPGPSQEPATDASRASDLLQAFLDGAGVALPPGAPASRSSLMRELGRTLREALLGIREMLLLRASIKSELPLAHTVIQATGNNPLKFAIDDEHALQLLLSSPRPGGLPASEAVRDGIRDLTIHEAMMARLINAARKDVLEQLSPDRVREQALSTYSSAFTPSRKARYWDAFVRVYTALAEFPPRIRPGKESVLPYGAKRLAKHGQ
jgi:type VI secretion system protein ImpI